MDHHTECKWLIHGTKRGKDIQLQSLELPCRIDTFKSSLTIYLINVAYP